MRWVLLQLKKIHGIYVKSFITFIIYLHLSVVKQKKLVFLVPLCGKKNYMQIIILLKLKLQYHLSVFVIHCSFSMNSFISGIYIVEYQSIVVQCVASDQHDRV